MDNNEIKSLCLSLLKADSEAEVISILKKVNYWDDPDLWRFYGDKENNYKDAGNQAAEAEAALVEKITNSRDARLLNECLVRGIDPEGEFAPKTLEQAVAKFFDEDSKDATAGLIREWTDTKRTEISRGVTVSLTGNKPDEGYPCVTISDCGEGQSPLKLPKTILSLGESIKMRIPFVHGKFNMGGTAVLRFCGHENLQLVVSRRNPQLLKKELRREARDDEWGFTIVRRNYPKGNVESTIEADDKIRSSTYTFLSPVGCDTNPNKGEILSFEAETLPIFPVGNNAYSKQSQWGTLVKLYEYKTKARSHFFMRDGLLGSLDILLPRIGLPVRLHECRAYKGASDRSFETTLTGIKVRLEDDKAKNLENGFPDSTSINVDGNKFRVTIYAFKDKKARNYRPASKGVLFTLNGQTQGWFSERFFAREKKVGLNGIKESILVIVDCTEISWETQEQLFQNSRDRLSTEPIRYQLEAELERLLKRHPGLSELKEIRRRQKKAEKLENSQAFENVLKSMFKHSRSMLSFFAPGMKLSNPFNTESVKGELVEFQGKKYPTYFHFRKLKDKEELKRDCNLNRRSRILFETDVVNDYFDRNIDPGSFELYYLMDGVRQSVDNYSINLYNGIATLNIALPASAEIGNSFSYEAIVTDSLRIIDPPFINKITLKVIEPVDDSKKSKSTRRRNPVKHDGEDRELPSGISIPQPTEVFKTSQNGGKVWSDMSPEFDKYTALKVEYSGEDDADYAGYDFYINMSNIYLDNEIVNYAEEAELVMEQYKIGMSLIGMSMIHSNELKKNEKKEDDQYEKTEISIDDTIEDATKAIAPILIPMINELADLPLLED